jgi:polar amino acid transport system permease protein
MTANVVAVVDWHLIWQRLFHPNHVFALALWTTIYIAITAELIAVVLGLVTALMRRSRFLFLRTLVGTYVLVFRGTPLIVQVFFIYFGANLFLGFDLFPRTVSFGLFNLSGAVVAGIVALGLHEGAYMSEIMRAGIDSIDRGQSEAALSLGMTPGQSMRRVVLPQAARVIVPPLGNSFNGMLKATSLLAFIGVYELFGDAQLQYSLDFQPVEIFAAVAVWYLVLTVVWSIIQAYIEKRLAVSDSDEKIPFTRRVMDAFAPKQQWSR